MCTIYTIESPATKEWPGKLYVNMVEVGNTRLHHKLLRFKPSVCKPATY